MNRSDIIKEISSSVTEPKEARYAVERTFEIISQALSRGEKVVIANFGTFRVSARMARQSRNPKTGQAVAVPPRKSVRFKASKSILQ